MKKYYRDGACFKFRSFTLMLTQVQADVFQLITLGPGEAGNRWSDGTITKRPCANGLTINGIAKFLDTNVKCLTYLGELSTIGFKKP